MAAPELPFGHHRLAGVVPAAVLQVDLIGPFAGERAYEIYLEHRRRHHPGEPVMSEREFWRRHFDSRGRNPGTRCC